MSALLKAAQKGHYAIPAMNFIDFNSAKAYVEASEEKDLPLILAFAQSHSDWLSLEEAAAIGRYFQEKAKTPIVLHLDHGQDSAFIKKAISLGFNSVMIDASLDSFDKNVRKTKEVVAYAQSHQVAVEAEIGFVVANENLENHKKIESIYTEVSVAKAFFQETQVDSLAVSIGTAHGIYKGRPHLNFQRLHEIAQELPIPLVLHGGSSSGNQNLKRCSQEGIAKINIFSDVMAAAYQKSRDSAAYDYPSLNRAMIEAMKSVLIHYYEVFGTKKELSL